MLDTKQVSTNLRQKLYQTFFLTAQYESRNQLQEDKWEKHKHMEIKQHATKKPVGQDFPGGPVV